MKTDKNKLENYLKRINAPVCPLCQHKDWSVNDTLFQLTEFTGPSINLGNKQTVFPVFTIMCQNCGNTYFINGIKSGIINPDDYSENKDDDKQKEGEHNEQSY